MAGLLFFLFFLIVIVVVPFIGKISKHLKMKKSLRYIERYVFKAALEKRLLTKYVEYSPQQIERVFHCLKDYLKICVLAKQRLVAMPSKIVDEAWHEFILDTREYHRFCQRAFGEYLHHYPFDNGNSMLVQKAMQLTEELVMELPGVKPTPTLPRLFSIDRELNVANGYYYDSNFFDDVTNVGTKTFNSDSLASIAVANFAGQPDIGGNCGGGGCDSGCNGGDGDGGGDGGGGCGGGGD
jgi:hypothetical protein